MSGVSSKTPDILRRSLLAAGGAALVGFTGGMSVLGKLEQTYSFRDFGAVGDGVTDDTAALLAAIASGETELLGVPGDVYLIEDGLIPVAGQVLNLRGAMLKMAGGTVFNNTVAMVELRNDGSSIKNFQINGNKAAVTHPTGNGALLAGVVVYASDTTVYRGKVFDCKTNGVSSYKTGIKNILLDTLEINTCGITGISNEIPAFGDVNVENLTIRHVRTSGNALGGLYISGGNKVVVRDVITRDANRGAFFGIGDAIGGLFDCKVSDCHFETTNAGTAACTVDGESHAGAHATERETCEVWFSNTSFKGAGGSKGLEVAYGARATVKGIKTDNTGYGLHVHDGAYVSGSDIITRNTSLEGIRLEERCDLKNITVEMYGVNSPGINLYGDAVNSSLENLAIGAATGETGKYGITAPAGMTGIKLKNFHTFTGTGAKLNASGTELDTWEITDCGTDYDGFQTGAWNGVATYSAGSWTWISAAGVMRVATQWSGSGA